ncbi:MAG: CaiB/BaiF CoA transferase family protein [Acidimicrobiales bacterium]|jgi:crotonobetainyl-CoA:carnitine CoA-transferase CaiB-like acyl-CoA transferase
MPLSHLTVLDLTLARAGPTAVRQFADWGANVIRIESPLGGNSITGDSEDDPDFQNLHRNKRAITINLKTPAGHELFMELAANADVIIENMRSDVKHRLGIDYESIRTINPKIVYGSLSGFGQDGPYGTRPGVDQIAQGMGGLMSITGIAGQGPVRVGIPISDLTAGMYLAMGCLTALLEREQSGKGQWVTTSLLEAQIAMLDFQAARWTMNNDVPLQAGNDHPTLIPMGTFPTSDGHMNLAAPNTGRFKALCKAIGSDGLADDPDYATGPLRSTNRVALNATIAEHTTKQSTAHWIQVLNEVSIPCGPINSIDETFADPQVQHLAMAAPLDHPRLGEIKIVRHAVSMNRTPHGINRHAPGAGEHTNEVLAEAGLSEDRITSLRASGAI